MKSENICLPSTDRLDDSNPTPDHYDEPNVAKVTPREILSFAWQICKGMAYLTDIKVINSDATLLLQLINLDLTAGA